MWEDGRWEEASSHQGTESIYVRWGGRHRCAGDQGCQRCQVPGSPVEPRSSLVRSLDPIWVCRRARSNVWRSLAGFGWPRLVAQEPFSSIAVRITAASSRLSWKSFMSRASQLRPRIKQAEQKTSSPRSSNPPRLPDWWKFKWHWRRPWMLRTARATREDLHHHNGCWDAFHVLVDGLSVHLQPSRIYERGSKGSLWCHGGESSTSPQGTSPTRWIRESKQGDVVAFMRKKGGAPRWFGRARVLTQEGKNVWILHGGVPILTAENMVRPASSEEYLEKELLGTEGQEARGLLYEEVRGPGQPGLGVQPAYLDYIEKRTRPTNRRFLQGGDEYEDGLRKRMRQLIKEQEAEELGDRREPTGQAHLPEHGRLEDVAIDDGPEEEAIEAAASSSQPVAAQLQHAPQPPVITLLIRAMRSAGGNQLDVGERMARKMRSETSEKAEESAARQGGEAHRTRWRRSSMASWPRGLTV